MGSLEKYSDKAVELFMTYAPKLVLAIATLVIGLWVIGTIVNITQKALEKSKTDKTLVPFLTSLVSLLLKVLLFISVASMVGIATTSFVAVLGAAGLAVGLALQGSLANFAGGVLILVFKPYSVGDLIEAQGHIGVVKELQIFSTILLTGNNKRVIIPNGAMSNGSIINYSTEGTLRVDLAFGITYESDVQKAKDLLLTLVLQNPRVLKDPAPVVAVSELAESAVKLVVRPWCASQDYWNVYFDTTEKAKSMLAANGIAIPYQQREVHVYQASA